MQKTRRLRWGGEHVAGELQPFDKCLLGQGHLTVAYYHYSTFSPLELTQFLAEYFHHADHVSRTKLFCGKKIFCGETLNLITVPFPSCHNGSILEILWYTGEGAAEIVWECPRMPSTEKSCSDRTLSLKASHSF